MWCNQPLWEPLASQMDSNTYELSSRIRQLHACLAIGNGKTAKLWKHAWLGWRGTKKHGSTSLWTGAKEKQNSSTRAHNNSWISVLQDKLTTSTQVEEFVSLWIRIQEISLNSEIEDSITANGQWTAFTQLDQHIELSFLDPSEDSKPTFIWHAWAGNKCKLFAWTLIQNKILTADNLARRSWPHQTSYGDRPTPLLTLPFCSRSLEPDSVLGAQDSRATYQSIKLW